MPENLHIAAPLLAWFDENKRILPFRTQSTPYRVWVSEIMLQQTRVSAALPYYERFMQALPTVAALAACDEEKLQKLWEGLGYYSRVRNLQKAARIVVEQYGGELPASYDAIRALPGIGDYTAGAIASISFGLPVAAVDGNVLRVYSRLLNDDSNILHPQTKKEFTKAVLADQPKDRCGAFNEALMELGALVCTPTSPVCEGCPLQHLCRAVAAGTQHILPVKDKPKARKLLPYTVALVLRAGDDALLLEKRPQKGLLAGLWQPILLEGALSMGETVAALAQRGLAVQPVGSAGKAKHVFTHLEWHMQGYVLRTETKQLPPECVFAPKAALDAQYAVPNAFKAYMKFYRSL